MRVLCNHSNKSRDIECKHAGIWYHRNTCQYSAITNVLLGTIEKEPLLAAHLLN